MQVNVSPSVCQWWEQWSVERCRKACGLRGAANQARRRAVRSERASMEVEQHTEAHMQLLCSATLSLFVLSSLGRANAQSLRNPQTIFMPTPIGHVFASHLPRLGTAPAPPRPELRMDVTRFQKPRSSSGRVSVSFLPHFFAVTPISLLSSRIWSPWSRGSSHPCCCRCAPSMPLPPSM